MSLPKKSSVTYFPTIGMQSSTQMNLPSITFNGQDAKKTKEESSEKDGLPCAFIPGMYLFLLLYFEMGNAFSTQWLKTFPFYICPVLSFCLFFQCLERDIAFFAATFVLILVFPVFQTNYFLGSIHLFALCILVSYGFWTALRHVLLVMVVICLVVNLCGVVVLYYMQDYLVIHVMWVCFFILGCVCTRHLWGKHVILR
jgi:hypothetical protein